MQAILFTVPTLAPTDSKLPRVLAICRALDRRRFRPYVSVDHPGRLDERGVALLRGIDVPVLTLRMSPHKGELARSACDLLRTPAQLRRHRIAIQHSFDYARWWTEPLVARLGGVRHWIPTKANTACGGPHWQLRLRLAERVVVQAPQMAKLLAERVPAIAHRLVLIPNGIDTDEFRPRPRDEELADELGLAHGGLVLGCVAHLVAVKDHPSLLRALAAAQRPDVQLLVVGADTDAEYAQEVRRLASEFGLARQVHFLGRRSDVGRLHSVMDGIILTSEAESCSNAVLEGMASGLPVIASAVGGLPDAVQAGRNGWLVPRGEGFVQCLATAIDDWATHPLKRRAFGVASRRIVLRRFSLRQMVQGHIELYERLLDEDPRERHCGDA